MLDEVTRTGMTTEQPQSPQTCKDFTAKTIRSLMISAWLRRSPLQAMSRMGFPFLPTCGSSGMISATIAPAPELTQEFSSKLCISHRMLGIFLAGMDGTGRFGSNALTRHGLGMAQRWRDRIPAGHVLFK